MGGKIGITPPPQRRKPSQPIDLTKPSRPPATSIIPPKLFVKLCEPLTPNDLFSLSQVSRSFRDLLCSPHSSATQSIWQKSRETFLSYPTLPLPPSPPHGTVGSDGMDERNYTLITNIAIRCQFCHDRKKQSHIYWAFQIRSCDDCFHQRTISEYRLLNHYRIPKEALCGLPYVSPCNYKVFWKGHISTAQSDYSLAVESDLLSVWMIQQETKLKRYIDVIGKHEQEFEEEMTKWAYHNTISLHEIKLRSSCIAEEIASDMKLDAERLRDWGIYWYPMNNNNIRNLNEDDWEDWRNEVEAGCKRIISRSSNKWYNRFTMVGRASVIY